MIKTLSIENFQSHKFSALAFSPGVNIIIGSSDSGKTSSIRALNWVISNRPLGDSFRSYWGGDTKVIVQTDQNVIERTRTDKKSYYMLDNNKDSIMSALNKEVPEEISLLMNITDINIQRQLDAPFLLSKGPGEVQKILNRIAHLDIIDSTMKNIERNRRKINSDIEYVTGQILKSKEELKKYDGLDSIEKSVEQLIKKSDTLESLKKKHPRLWDILDELRQKTSRIEYLKKIIGLEDEINDLLKKYNQLEKLFDDDTSMKYTIRKIKGNVERAERLNKTTKLEEKVDFILHNIKSRNEIDDRSGKIFDITDKLKRNITRLTDLKKSTDKLEAAFKAEFPDACPLCGKVK